MRRRLHHYTTRAFAEEVCRDLDDLGYVLMEVGEDGLYGPGIYALSEGVETDIDTLRRLCFGDARPEHPMDGVIILDPLLADEPGFIEVENGSWLLPRSPFDREDVTAMILAVGWRTKIGIWNVHAYE